MYLNACRRRETAGVDGGGGTTSDLWPRPRLWYGTNAVLGLIENCELVDSTDRLVVVIGMHEYEMVVVS